MSSHACPRYYQYTCPCCGHRTLESFHDWDMCLVCYWEDDMLGDEDGNSPANQIWLSQAQANYMLYGASKEQYCEYVRSPLPSEPLDPLWKPFTSALELVAQAKAKSQE